MRSQDSRSRPISRTMAVAALSLGLTGITAAQQRTQSIYLPDPTPRPPDLQREYGDDPQLRAKQEQAAKLRSAMQMQQVVSATNALVLLSKELKDEVVQHQRGVPMPSEIVKVEEIEKLAKRVKEAMKSR